MFVLACGSTSSVYRLDFRSHQKLTSEIYLANHHYLNRKSNRTSTVLWLHFLCLKVKKPVRLAFVGLRDEISTSNAFASLSVPRQAVANNKLRSTPLRPMAKNSLDLIDISLKIQTWSTFKLTVTKKKVYGSNKLPAYAKFLTKLSVIWTKAE